MGTRRGRDVPEARGWTNACLALIDSTHWVAFRPWPAARLAETELVDGDITTSRGASLDEAFALSCGPAYPCWEGATARGISLAHAAGGELAQAPMWIDQALVRSQRCTDACASTLAGILATSSELSAAVHDHAHRREGSTCGCR
jgi:hypothetical protein